MKLEQRGAALSLSRSRSLAHSDYGWGPHTKRQFGLTDVWARFRSMPKLTKLNCPLTHTHIHMHTELNGTCVQLTVNAAKKLSCAVFDTCAYREFWNGTMQNASMYLCHPLSYFSLFLNFNVFALVGLLSVRSSGLFTCLPACLPASQSIFSLRMSPRYSGWQSNSNEIGFSCFGQRFRCPSPRAQWAHLRYGQRITYSNYNEMEANQAQLQYFSWQRMCCQLFCRLGLLCCLSYSLFNAKMIS